MSTVVAHAAEDAATAEARLSSAVGFLASDELEGRGVGTKGLDVAADYIAGQFAAAGLQTSLYDGTAFQSFSMTTGTELGEKNEIVLIGPADDEGQPRRIELELNEGFSPMALGGSGTFDLPLVFVGYGISAKDENYDDYADVNVEGKAVVVLRHEPQQDNPHSVFNGTRTSAYAPFTRKISNAFEHGAAAIIFCTDEFEIRTRVNRRMRSWQNAIDDLAKASEEFNAIEDPSLERIVEHKSAVARLLDKIAERGTRVDSEIDPLLPFGTASGDSEQRSIPVLFFRRAIVNSVLASLDTDLPALEHEIDVGPTPHSLKLDGWRIQGEVTVHRTQAEVKNVVGVLEGSGPLADETIVIGAHYDHLGYGGSGSLAPGTHEIHNGADDNGSGTAALIEVARRLAARPHKLPRRVVFIAFTAEERGLIGSAHYVRDPLFPLEKTIAMLNMDMVGRLKDEKLIVHGTGTAAVFDPLIDELNETYGFDISRNPGGFGPSDHSSFYAKQIPVLHFFTGTHADYHRPSDDVEKLNVEGMRRIAELVGDAAIALAEAESRPEYAATPLTVTVGGGGDRPYFGSIPDFAQPEEPGYLLSGVSKDGPAEKAGLKSGDIIVHLGDSKIGGLEDFDSALRKYNAGDKVKVVIKRDGQQMTFEVTLGEPR